MFLNCESLTYLSLSYFHFDNVKYMQWMFAYCFKIEKIIFPDIQTTQLQNMEYMFYECQNLKEILS